jgi:hypothetical protein
MVMSPHCNVYRRKGGNDISKLLGQGEIAQMTYSAQLEIGIPEADTITMSMGCTTYTYIVETKDFDKRQKCGK